MSARTGRRSAVALVLASFAVAALTACGNAAPGETPSASPSVSAPSTPSNEPSAAPSEPTPTPTETSDAGADIQLPSDCESIYSPAMLESLNGANPPLNDPEVSLFSTGIEAVYNIQQSGIPTLRCTWGVPSEVGLATTVSLVDAEQASTIEDLLVANSLTCEDYAGGRMCRIVIDYPEDDFSPAHSAGETHYLRGNGWIASSWINFGPQGYTEDIVATLWG